MPPLTNSGRFYLRPRVLSITHAYLSTSPLPLLAQPVLNRLGDALNEACSLAILDGDEIAYLARSASSRIMSPALNVGRRLPAYCTSIGQVMLAHLPPAELDDYLKRVKLHRFTEQTVASPRQLLALLRNVRDAGHAVASQQMESRLCTLAVPVRDTSGQFVAGMNVILGRPMAERDMVARFLQPLQSAAAELGSLLLSLKGDAVGNVTSSSLLSLLGFTKQARNALQGELIALRSAADDHAACDA